MKGFQRIICIFCLLLLLPLPVFAQEESSEDSEGLKPPELYSQAAILMDMDTGQVLWGKNERERMYPASLTKIVTCLLAMERGNFSDLVTVTDEVVDTVPKDTTHIALDYDEELTLEQLVYAMMVESANDAANGVAVQIGGSIDGFVEMMNQKAQEIGAKDTHFTNANGLPEDDHYTTAYDLALFTKEAMKYPQFRELAGTQVYEIPPTNKQSQTRTLRNRQYMFCLNDTYPGAFAGKTGWTEEAGTCLMTLAQRDDITLACVVLKASGTVDAEFKDSTALLDYGFENFRREWVPSTQIPDQQGEDGIWSMEENLPVLLPANLGVSQLELTIDSSGEPYQAVLAAPEQALSYMGKEVARFPMTFEAAPVGPAPAQEELEEPQSEGRIPAFWKHPLAWVGLALLLLLVLGGLALFCIRQYLLAKYRRRKKRREALRRRQMVQSKSVEPVIDVTIDKGRKNHITILSQEKWEEM